MCATRLRYTPRPETGGYITAVPTSCKHQRLMPLIKNMSLSEGEVVGLFCLDDRLRGKSQTAGRVAVGLDGGARAPDAWEVPNCVLCAK